MGNGWPINYRGNPLTVATKNNGLDAAPRSWSRVDDKKPLAKFHHGLVPIKMSTRSSVTQTGSAYRLHLNLNSLHPLLLLSFPFHFYFSFIPIPFLSWCFHLHSAISDPSYSPSFRFYVFFIFVRSYMLFCSSLPLPTVASTFDPSVIFNDINFPFSSILSFHFFRLLFSLIFYLLVIPILPSFDYISIITRQLFFLFHSLNLPLSSPSPVPRRCLSCFSFFLLRPPLLRTSLFLYPVITLIDPLSFLSRSFHFFFIFHLLSCSLVFPISVIFDRNYLRTGVSAAEAPALNSRFTGELYTG